MENRYNPASAQLLAINGQFANPDILIESELTESEKERVTMLNTHLTNNKVKLERLYKAYFDPDLSEQFIKNIDLEINACKGLIQLRKLEIKTITRKQDKELASLLSAKLKYRDLGIGHFNICCEVDRFSKKIIIDIANCVDVIQVQRTFYSIFKILELPINDFEEISAKQKGQRHDREDPVHMVVKLNLNYRNKIIEALKNNSLDSAFGFLEVWKYGMD